MATLGSDSTPGRYPAACVPAFAIAALLALAACSRGPAGPAVPATFREAMNQASDQWALNRWDQVFTACDRAFRYADKDRDAKVIWAAECVAEAAVRMGRPEAALPHYERLFAAYADRLMNVSGRHRLANNFGVLLIETGKRERGIQRLRDAMDAYEGTAYHIAAYGSFTARAMMVKNLARATYGSASDPAVRAWVQEQGVWLHEHMTRNVRSVHLSMGASSALQALVDIGRRQANTTTPDWEAVIREWEPQEEAIGAQFPHLASGCEDIALKDVMMQACMRELQPPP